MNDEIKRACEILSRGGIILYPTDTIWGIGCDAMNEAAVKRVYEIKQRADSKSMLVLIDSPDYLDYYVDDLPEIALNLIEVADKPLTIIYSGAKNLAPNLIAGDGSIGIRITKEKFSQGLCARFKKPVVSTSANISGMPSPGNFSEIDENIKKSVDYIVNFRREEKNNPEPSGIIKLGKGGEIQIIRP
ncbi:threonylcarbamoyl-AMP synthase [Bacteroidia bacterium]|nr:threonylcarbamoyl-AMP synthase [Bacteroidia bacterium]GHU89479.1 threonylcarbamoyl-AMP synthase [Bacteroidia bacterium]